LPRSRMLAFHSHMLVLPVATRTHVLPHPDSALAIRRSYCAAIFEGEGSALSLGESDWVGRERNVRRDEANGGLGRGPMSGMSTE